MSEQPTDEQIKEFWEGCGIKEATISGNYDDWILNSWGMTWETYKRKKGTIIPLPPIDLNNLFKYAVPKVLHTYFHTTMTISSFTELIAPYAPIYKVEIMNQPTSGGSANDRHYRTEDKDPALALFWAIHEVMKND